MKYIKYEKVLYEITEEQEQKMRALIEKGGRVSIYGDFVFANKCEIISSLPANRDDYEIRQSIITNALPDGGEYYTRINRENAENMKRWLSQTPEQKTERQWECIAKTKYLLRNKWQEPNPQRVEMIKAKILAWFQGKNEAWCPAEVYEDLLPPVEKVAPGRGFQRIGELVR